MIGFHQHPDPAVGKAQWVRLVDIWLLGPAMIYVGVSGRIPEAWRTASVIGGLITIVYNLQNYRRVEVADRITGP